VRPFSQVVSRVAATDAPANGTSGEAPLYKPTPLENNKWATAPYRAAAEAMDKRMQEVLAGSSGSTARALPVVNFPCRPVQDNPQLEQLVVGAGNVRSSGWCIGDAISAPITDGTAVFLVAEHVQGSGRPCVVAVGEADGNMQVWRGCSNDGALCVVCTLDAMLNTCVPSVRLESMLRRPPSTPATLCA
jgi:hypothetical protein